MSWTRLRFSKGSNGPRMSIADREYISVFDEVVIHAHERIPSITHSSRLERDIKAKFMLASQNIGYLVDYINTQTFRELNFKCKYAIEFILRIRKTSMTFCSVYFEHCHNMSFWNAKN